MMNSIYVSAAAYETFNTSDGREFIDLSGGFGYQIPEIITSVSNQLDKIGLSNRVLISAPLIALCEALADALGPNFESSYVCNSGDEAFEGAMKLVRGMYPTRKTIIAVSGNNYGNMTYGSLASEFNIFSSLTSYLGVRVIWVSAETNLKEIDAWKDCLAFCYGPFIRSSDGTRRLLDTGWIDSAEELARRHGSQTIWTDIDTCLGSLGEQFSHELLRAHPNLVVLGNSLGGGCIPIGTYSCSQSMAYAAYGRHSPAKHGSTTAGNPPSCIAALAALQLSKEQKFWQRCTTNGNLLAAALKEYPISQFGGWVCLKLDTLQQASTVRHALLAAGIFVRSEGHAEIVFRCPLSARTSVIQSAAKTIGRTLHHVI